MSAVFNINTTTADFAALTSNRTQLEKEIRVIFQLPVYAFVRSSVNYADNTVAFELYGIAYDDFQLVTKRFGAAIVEWEKQLRQDYPDGDVTVSIEGFPVAFGGKPTEPAPSNSSDYLVSILVVIIVILLGLLLHCYCKRPKIKQNEKPVFLGFEHADANDLNRTDQKYLEQLDIEDDLDDDPDFDVYSDQDDIEIEMDRIPSAQGQAAPKDRFSVSAMDG